MTKLISIITPCFNEEDNVEELCERIAAVMATLPYDYEHILIDNRSTDGTVERLREIAKRDEHVKVIVNARNFGHIRSPQHAVMQARGDAVIGIASDLQDPPEMIPSFIEKWEQGYKTVLATKPETDEGFVMKRVRRLYYRLVSKISEIPLVHHATGAGLYDRVVIEVMRKIDDPYPYFRGLVSEIGFPIAEVPFTQPRRKRGISKNNFYTLFDLAMLGVTNHSKVPLRIMTMLGFLIAGLSLTFAVGFLIAKLAFWNHFSVGTAPILIGMFFIGSVQLMSLGILGEYIGSIHTKVRKLPLVVEAERINFTREDGTE